MVRRDQDGGHRSEKSGPKIPGFHSFVPRLCWAFSRACILSSAFDDRREKRSDRRRFASSAILARVGRGTRAFLAGPVRIARGNVWRRFVFVSPGLHPRRVVPSTNDGDTSSATRLMENKREKLEDLVRLALKRLNISYLTISSRLVWFERETFVCVANANDEGNDARDSRSRRGS